MKSMLTVLTAAALLATAGCSSQAADTTHESADLRLRNLTETTTAAPRRANYQIEGDLIPTPSDSRTRYYLLSQRSPLLAGTVIAVLREERGDKAAYARVEVACDKRQFHIVGVGNRRSFAETSVTRDGPLRSIESFPLRQEIAAFVCDKHGTPLAAPAARS
jgi:hypothetical protein